MIAHAPATKKYNPMLLSTLCPVNCIVVGLLPLVYLVAPHGIYRISEFFTPLLLVVIGVPPKTCLDRTKGLFLRSNLNVSWFTTHIAVPSILKTIMR